jgi:hypothetical protein
MRPQWVILNLSVLELHLLHNKGASFMNTLLEFFLLPLENCCLTCAVHMICVNLCKWSYEHIFYLCFELLKQIISVLIGHLAC